MDMLPSSRPYGRPSVQQDAISAKTELGTVRSGTDVCPSNETEATDSSVSGICFSTSRQASSFALSFCGLDHGILGSIDSRFVIAYLSLPLFTETTTVLIQYTPFAVLEASASVTSPSSTQTLTSPYGAFIAIECAPPRALLGVHGTAGCLFAIAGGLDLGQGLPVPSPFGLLQWSASSSLPFAGCFEATNYMQTVQPLAYLHLMTTYLHTKACRLFARGQLHLGIAKDVAGELVKAE